mmetsp:Transcript_1884/g.4287  ORF Transcript_1884/g.4287 Transcript_1884/m.4287 type:complete len:186 (+) Transcript_1884:139-696(+)
MTGKRVGLAVRQIKSVAKKGPAAKRGSAKPARGGGRAASDRGRGRGRGGQPRGSESGGVPPAHQHQRVIRREETEEKLASPASAIGPGTRAAILFHEDCFDSAMIAIAPNRCEMAETNTSDLAMLYFVTEAEDGKIEFELPDAGVSQMLSSGCEVLVPPHTAYALRNHSETQEARFMAVVPRPKG